jgi:hypothetical protein
MEGDGYDEEVLMYESSRPIVAENVMKKCKVEEYSIAGAPA